MKVRIRLFGPPADAADSDSIEVELAEGRTVRDLLRAAAAERPELEGLLESVAVAVNLQYVSRDRTLRADDEVAVIPPVSGG
jgi:molybdopterin synthase catalytic subunit